MTNSELELWNKIEAFRFDKPYVKLTFAKRLANENGIPEHFANEIIDEYRKFIFLCCVSEGQMAPSHFVDLAWHLHLTYTKSYWIDLCKDTINRDLHHNPTEGGKEEDEKFKDLYKTTLSLYESYFSSKPPEAVWPNGIAVAQNTIFKIDKNRNWVIPKPDLSFHGQKNSFAIIAVILCTLLLGCTSYAGSLPFVLGFVLVAGVVFFLVRRRNRRSKAANDSSGCAGIFGSSDSGDSDGGGGDSGCSSGCSGGCGGGD